MTTGNYIIWDCYIVGGCDKKVLVCGVGFWGVLFDIVYGYFRVDVNRIWLGNIRMEYNRTFSHHILLWHMI